MVDIICVPCYYMNFGREERNWRVYPGNCRVKTGSNLAGVNQRETSGMFMLREGSQLK